VSDLLKQHDQDFGETLGDRFICPLYAICLKICFHIGPAAEGVALK
jgi:hypothetical protein